MYDDDEGPNVGRAFVLVMLVLVAFALLWGKTTKSKLAHGEQVFIPNTDLFTLYEW